LLAKNKPDVPILVAVARVLGKFKSTSTLYSPSPGLVLPELFSSTSKSP